MTMTKTIAGVEYRRDEQDPEVWHGPDGEYPIWTIDDLRSNLRCALHQDEPENDWARGILEEINLLEELAR
jgi:hypothetical protein